MMIVIDAQSGARSVSVFLLGTNGHEDVMNEEWLIQMLSNRWILAIGAFSLGFIAFWLLQSFGLFSPKQAELGENTVVVGLDPSHGEKLDALAAEIEKAKTMLEEQQADHEVNEEILDELDGAVKRANGRLKLILNRLNA